MHAWVPQRWRFEWHDSLPSTNDHLKALARDGADGGTVVVARTQTAGRGRGDHTWRSPHGGLYVSVLLRGVPGPVAEVLPLACGAAVLEAVERFDLDLSAWLKWPNDLLVGPAGAPRPQGKAGGILIESASRGDTVEWAVVGLGIDLTVPPEALAGLDPPAVSLLQFDPLAPHLEQFLATFLDRFGAALDRTAADPAWPAAAVAPRLAYLDGAVSVSTPAGTRTGTLRGLTPRGHLRLDVGADEQVLPPWEATALRPTT